MAVRQPRRGDQTARRHASIVKRSRAGYRYIVAIVARSQDSGLGVNEDEEPTRAVDHGWSGICRARVAMTVTGTYLLQLTLNGITLGLLYALIAVGLSLIFGVMEIINFAHGEFLMLGAFAMTFILPVVGLLYAPALLAAVLIAALGGFLLFELFLSRLGQHDFERSILITIGLSIMLLHGTQYLVSATPRLVDTELGFEGVAIGAIRITWTRLIGGGLALAAFAALYVLLTRTPFGRAMRAIAQNREAALMV